MHACQNILCNNFSPTLRERLTVCGRREIDFSIGLHDAGLSPGAHLHTRTDVGKRDEDGHSRELNRHEKPPTQMAGVYHSGTIHPT